MPRSLALGLVVVLATAIGLWLYFQDGAPAPADGPNQQNPSHDVSAGSGGVATPAAGAVNASGSGVDRVAAEPTVDGPDYVVEGLVLADPARPDLSDAHVLAYRGSASDSAGMMMPSMDRRNGGAPPAFIVKGDPIARAPVDSSGHFELHAPEPHLRLMLEHDFYLLPTPEIVHAEVDDPAHVVLAPALGACIRGRLFGERADAVETVRLSLEPDPMSVMRDPRLFFGALASNRRRATPTPENGFVFRGVVPGAPIGLTVRGSGTYGRIDQAPLVPGETREVALSVRAAALLDVTVRDPADQPIEDVTVLVTPAAAKSSMIPQIHARHEDTDADGRCTIDSLVPGQVEIEVSASGYLGASETRMLRAAPAENVVELTLGEGGVVTGIVRNERGEPIEGAHVAHQPMAEIPVIGDLTTQLGPTMLAAIASSSRITTAADGTFRLTGLDDDNEFTVVAAHDDYAAGHVSGIEMGDDLVEITLPQLSAVTGTVVTATDGTPVDRFEVRIVRTSFLVMKTPVRIENVTSEDGTFRLTGLPPGSLTAEIAATGFSKRSKSLEVTGTGDVDLGTIELHRGATVTGIVRDEIGNPVRGALVRKRKGPMMDNPVLAMFAGAGEQARTDPDGRFRLAALPPGRIQLVASADGFASARSERVELEAGEVRDGLDIALGHGGAIDGQLLVGPGGRPADYVVIAQEQRSQLSVTADLAPDGKFEMRNLDPGTWIVQAMPAGIFSSAGTMNDFQPGKGVDIGAMMEQITSNVVSERCRVRAGETSEVELDAADLITGTRWTVRVAVGDAPLSTGIVEATRVDGSSIRVGILFEGRAILSNVEPGPYRVQIRSGMTMAQIGAPQDLEFPAGKQEHSTRIELPGGELRGRVVDAESGDPLAMALVRLIHEDAAERDDPIGMALTNTEGEFVFSGLLDGRYGVVTAEMLGGNGERDGAASERNIEVAAGRTTRAIELQSQPAAGAVVTITDEAGAPVAGATALCVDADGHPLGAFGLATTDPDGRAWFGGLPRGEGRIVARAPGLSPGASDLLRLDPERSVQFSLVLTSGARTTVQAVDRTGQPLEGATISARISDGPWLPAMLLVERTGPGTFDLGRLGPGSWEFRVQHPKVGTLTQSRGIGNERAITVVIAPR